jgi:hypothetical protein
VLRAVKCLLHCSKWSLKASVTCLIVVIIELVGAFELRVVGSTCNL